MQRATDWDEYYDQPFAASKLTRRYTGHWLKAAIGTHLAGRTEIEVLEFGGGNSCFFRELVDALPVSRYEVADLNAKSLRLFEQQAREAPSVRTAAHRVNLLAETPAPAPADVVFSVGLIEHFDPEGTRQVARRHFACVKEGGIVIITAPTPTWLYRMTRGAAERLGMWKFPDERPLSPREMLASCEGLGTPLLSQTLWPLVLTQHAVVWRAGKQ
jgi:spermidine synthase